VVSFFLFSLPNHSCCRLDVCHTSTHGVALVRIWNAGLKCTARGSLKMQDTKNRHLGTIAQLCRAISSQLTHISTIGKKPVKQQYLLHMSPTSGRDCFVSLGHPSKFQRLSHLCSLPSNRHHPSSGDCPEGKGENYEVCSVHYCVQQLCTVRCTHI